MPRRWAIRLSREAERDVQQIFLWSMERFGIAQARRYRSVILATLAELTDGPEPAGSTDRSELMPGLRSLHVARHGRRGRHFVLYDTSASRQIRVVRILHDSMDLARNLEGRPGDNN